MGSVDDSWIGAAVEQEVQALHRVVLRLHHVGPLRPVAEVFAPCRVVFLERFFLQLRQVLPRNQGTERLAGLFRLVGEYMDIRSIAELAITLVSTDPSLYSASLVKNGKILVVDE